jgi:hypothetical protein
MAAGLAWDFGRKSHLPRIIIMGVGCPRAHARGMRRCGIVEHIGARVQSDSRTGSVILLLMFIAQCCGT